MAGWSDFAAEAPTIAEVFVRRHAATHKLCMLATLRSDGFPRISPMEPWIFEGRLVLIGMPHTTKFLDLARDPRFNLHTATVDPFVGEGDAKLWGTVGHLPEPDVHRRFAAALYADSGLDLRGQEFDPFYVADLSGAASVTFADDVLTITSWKPGQGERVRRKS